jgi:hypothetical protein
MRQVAFHGSPTVIAQQFCNHLVDNRNFAPLADVAAPAAGRNGTS